MRPDMKEIARIYREKRQREFVEKILTGEKVKTRWAGVRGEMYLFRGKLVFSPERSSGFFSVGVEPEAVGTLQLTEVQARKKPADHWRYN